MTKFVFEIGNLICFKFLTIFVKWVFEWSSQVCGDLNKSIDFQEIKQKSYSKKSQVSQINPLSFWFWCSLMEANRSRVAKWAGYLKPYVNLVSGKIIGAKSWINHNHKIIERRRILNMIIIKHVSFLFSLFYLFFIHELTSQSFKKWKKI